MDISLNDFIEAENRIAPYIHRTETMSSIYFSDYIGGNAFLKCENLQKTASFKIRGATNKILKMSVEGKQTSFIAASSGNHAQGVAYASRSVGAKAKIVMPLNAPLMKIDAVEGYGAEVVLNGSCFDEAYNEAIRIYEDEHSTFIHPYNDVDVISGQGTIAIEILEDCPEADVILVPAGGGGLLSGVATAAKKIKPGIQVIGVQAEGANAISQSFAEKKHVITESSQTIADGIAVRNPGDICLDLILQNVDDILEVDDGDLSLAILTVLERAKLILEPAGASSVAALMKYKDKFKGKNVVCVLSGGNVDTKNVYHYLEIGMMKLSRWLRFLVIIHPEKGDLSKVINCIVNECGAKVLDFDIDRYLSGNCTDIACKLTCEVRNAEHKDKLLSSLRKNYTVILPEVLNL